MKTNFRVHFYLAEKRQNCDTIYSERQKCRIFFPIKLTWKGDADWVCPGLGWMAVKSGEKEGFPYLVRSLDPGYFRHGSHR